MIAERAATNSISNLSLITPNGDASAAHPARLTVVRRSSAMSGNICYPADEPDSVDIDSSKNVTVISSTIRTLSLAGANGGVDFGRILRSLPGTGEWQDVALPMPGGQRTVSVLRAVNVSESRSPLRFSLQERRTRVASRRASPAALMAAYAVRSTPAISIRWPSGRGRSTDL